MKQHQVIVIGGGPAGSTLGALLAKESIDVAIIEKEEFPRFHIGESLLPASMPIFKKSGFWDVLNSGKYIKKYGARFVDYRLPEEIYFGFSDGINPDIPMAFEVPRDEFDKDILKHAASCGATVYQPENVLNVSFDEGAGKVVTENQTYQGQYIIDASGRRSFLGSRNKNRVANHDLNNVGVFAHFTGVKRAPGKKEGDITIGVLPGKAWSWTIPFKGDVTSVGVVCSSQHFDKSIELDTHLKNYLHTSKLLQAAMESAERVSEVRVISNYSHRCEKLFGPRWLLVGDAAVFLDPIFSSGVHVGVQSAALAATTIQNALKSDSLLTDNQLGGIYQKEFTRGVRRFHSLISLFYDDHFVQRMTKTLTLNRMRKAFTSVVAGDMWNEENFLFERGVL